MVSASPNVLIVDDNPNLGKTLCDILEINGYQPKCFSRGNPAVSWAENEAPIIAIIDVQQGDMSGLEVMRGIKIASPRTECIILTEHASQVSIREAINLGAFACFQKPIDIKKLLLAIQNAVENNTSTVVFSESEECFMPSTQYAQDLIFRYEVTSPPGFTYLGPATTVITGRTPDEFYTDPNLLFKITHPDDRQLLLDIEQGGEIIKRLVELRWLHKNGSLVWVELHSVPVVDSEGNVIAIEGVARDITDLKHAEARF